MKKITIVSLIIIYSLGVYSQGINNLWLHGYNNPVAPPFGGCKIDFATGQPVVTVDQRKMNFGDANANIADSAGNLLFSSNGIFVANSDGDTMVNGNGLNPSFFTDWYIPLGYLPLSQANLIIPAPGSSQIYYLFHSTLDTTTSAFGFLAPMKLYYTVIDMTQDSGRGAVITKNNVVIADTLTIGKITATKHANGRDWWVVCHKLSSKRFFKLLLTPSGILGPFTQDIGMIRNGGSDGGQVCFSPDGSRFAYYTSYQGQPGAQLFNFNRCTGMFSQPYLLDVYDTTYGACGVSFSPNSDILYVSAEYKVYQFDCSALDINSTKYLVAEWDSFFSPPGPSYHTTFYTSQLAADGKIYICSNNSSMFLHIIDQPDVLGTGCNIIQHGLQLPVYNGIGSIPNHPNYFLGALTGSPCDTLTAIDETNTPFDFNIYPNPAQDFFNLSYLLPQNMEGELQIAEITGKVVLSKKLHKFSTNQRIDTKDLSNGIYTCLITSANLRVIKKLVIHR